MLTWTRVKVELKQRVYSSSFHCSKGGSELYHKGYRRRTSCVFNQPARIRTANDRTYLSQPESKKSEMNQKKQQRMDPSGDNAREYAGWVL